MNNWRRLAQISLVGAWLLATGSHWDFVQTFAWARMFATNVRTMSMGQALRETFDADKRCALCEAVAEAKQHEQSSPTTPLEKKFGEKITLVFHPQLEFISKEVLSQAWWETEARPSGQDKPRPPVPPPRSAA